MATLRRRDVLGFAAGDFGFNLYWSMTNLYLLFFYTDVLGFSATAGGTLIMAALIWDAFADAGMGAIAARTRTRWGRYRPFILFAAPLTAAAFVLMFTQPALPPPQLFFWAAVTHIIFRTVYTVQSIPYLSLSAVLTDDSGQRGRLASARMVAAMTASLLVAFLTPPLAMLVAPRVGEGYGSVALLYSLIAMAMFATTFFTTRERVEMADGSRASLSDIGRLIAGNRAFLLLFVAIVAGSSGSTIFQKTMVYYVKYDIGAPEAVGTVLAVLLGTMAITIPIWQQVALRTSKRAVWIAGAVWSSSAWLLWYVLDIDTLPEAYALIAIGGVGAATFPLSFWSMVPDTVEYGVFRTGVRAESALFGLVSFAQKTSLGLGVGALGLMLDWIGYHANAAQTPATLDAIERIMIFVPVGLSAVGVVAMLFYPIDAKLHARLVRVLTRRSRTTAQVPPGEAV